MRVEKRYATYLEIKLNRFLFIIFIFMDKRFKIHEITYKKITQRIFGC